MTTPADAFTQLISDINALTDPTERARAATALLDAVPGLQKSARTARQEAVLELRAKGNSHADVAALLGITRSRAQQIAEGRSGGTARKQP
ncbi:RNA polymerase subunit sigma-70 [Streptomyces sp. NPDC059740]|uniref:RNA polymerase subunit sigma-70 n=1 Tax=Streptomyces sp. NPDC059740 TaxID=3346926 RepID=UPI00364C15D3